MKWTNKGHEFDEIGKLFKKKHPIYIYGTGELGADLFYRLGFADCVEGFIDNDVSKKEFMGKQVLRINEFLDKKIDAIVVVCGAPINLQFMENQLRYAGFRDGVNLFNFYSFIRYYMPIYAMYAWDCLYFHSISITTSFKCNLRCKACLAFVDKSKKHETQEINSIKQSIDDLFKAVDYVEFIDIAGGEPLLYKDLEELIEFVGQKYRRRVNRIYVTTNGTVEPKDSLCQTMKKYNIMFNIDDYRGTTVPDKMIVVEAMEDKAKKHGVNYRVNKVDIWIDLKYGEVNNSHMTDEELQNYFISCQQEWPELYKSKIYYCDYSTYAARGGLMDLYPEEAFDISSFDKKERMALFEYGRGYSEKGYLEMCKKCGGYLGINRNYIEVARQETLG